jgi:hypothetical protein
MPCQAFSSIEIAPHRRIAAGRPRPSGSPWLPGARTPVARMDDSHSLNGTRSESQPTPSTAELRAMVEELDTQVES